MFQKIISLTFTLLFAFSICLADDIPAWLSQDAAIKVPAYDKDVPGVALRDDQSVTFTSEGKIIVTTNYSVRILLREGRSLANAAASYLSTSGKVREINAWLIKSNGVAKKFDKDSIVDMVSDPDDVYNEYRVKYIDGSREADEGSVFGYQIVSEERPLFYQDIWAFQNRLPTISSRYTLNLPNGWKASNITFNHENLTPQVSGTSYSWELRNLPPIPPEVSSPTVRNLAPRIAVNYFPEDSAKASSNQVFANWQDVSRWATAMHDPAVIIDDAITIKARDLTANATTEFEKIRAISKYVQNLQYISIDIGVGYGNGYRPRSSTLVLNRGFGDCKDKANLMRALLRVLKIEAYPIAIFSGDSTYTREAWASPSQFNHCIIAISVSDATKAPSIITDAKLGRLLIFDATDPYTALGDFPDHEQGSMALMIAGDNGGLVKMPILPSDSSLLDRKIDATLTADGSFSGTIRETGFGQESATFRAQQSLLSPDDYNKMIERWLTSGATGAKAGKITQTDNVAEGKFVLDVEFSAPKYGQLMQGRLLVFKPAFVGRRGSIGFTQPTRKHPILFESNSFSETVSVALPAGFAVDEMPDPLKLETDFGKYTSSYVVKDNKLVFTRVYTLNQISIMPEKYETVKDFYKKILNAEQSPVVLLKK
jgi:Domain of Unknown Function with PDB structure (DUF3857)/Transglutaminase-like superfamily